MRLSLAVVITAAFGAYCAISQPIWTFAVFAGILVLGIFLTRPKLGVGITVITVMFGTTVETATSLSILGYADELLIVLSLAIFVTLRLYRGQLLRPLPGTNWLLLFVLIGALSCLVRDVPAAAAVQSLFLTLKGFVLAFAVAQLDWDGRDIRKMVKPAVGVLILVLVTSVINLAMPGFWTDLFGRTSAGVSYRLGLPSLIGPFDHPFAYGQFMALAIAALIAYRVNIRKSVGSGILLAASMMGVLLSFRRKAIAAAAAAALSARLLSPGKRLSTALGVVVIAPLALLIGWDSLTSVVQFTYDEYFLNPSETARTLMYRDSVALSLAYFPLGAGFSRFGSFTASQIYSLEYIELGYNFIYKMGPGDKGGFLSDTFWPAILGESGIFGTIAFILALFFLARTGHTLVRSTSDPYIRWAGIVSVSWFIEFAIESIAAPSFNSPPLFALLFALAGVCTAILHSEPRHLSQQRLAKKPNIIRMTD